MAPKYKLIYFNFKGRAGTIRYIFAAAGIKYEDFIVESGKLDALKPNLPFGCIPVLEVDGKQIAESTAICRYLAKETGLAGKNNIETAVIDSVASTINDIQEKLIAVSFAKVDDKAKAELAKKYGEETLPKILEKLENFLKNSKTGDNYFVGNKLSWADLHFQHICDNVLTRYATALDTYPKLKALQARVAALPKVAAFIKDRPVTEY